MNRREALRALRISAWIVAFAALAVALAPHVVPERPLLALAARVEGPHPHGRCPMCGMTTAFVAIARGDRASAARANHAAYPLYLAMLFGPLTLLGGGAAWRVRRDAHPAPPLTAWRPPCP